MHLRHLCLLSKDYTINLTKTEEIQLHLFWIRSCLTCPPIDNTTPFNHRQQANAHTPTSNYPRQHEVANPLEPCTGQHLIWELIKLYLIDTSPPLPLPARDQSTTVQISLRTTTPPPQIYELICPAPTAKRRRLNTNQPDRTQTPPPRGVKRSLTQFDSRISMDLTPRCRARITHPDPLPPFPEPNTTPTSSPTPTSQCCCQTTYGRCSFCRNRLVDKTIATQLTQNPNTPIQTYTRNGRRYCVDLARDASTPISRRPSSADKAEADATDDDDEDEPDNDDDDDVDVAAHVDNDHDDADDDGPATFDPSECNFMIELDEYLVSPNPND